MKLAATLLLIGMAPLAYAFSIAPYKDEELFMERHMALSAGQGEGQYRGLVLPFVIPERRAIDMT
jgi:hypothetical protein